MTTKTKKHSRILEAVYETANDFHHCGVFNQEQKNRYEELRLSSPVSVSLDTDVVEYLNKKCDFDPEKLRVLINDLLRKDIEIAQRVTL